MSQKKLRITLTRSSIGANTTQKRTIAALGLRKISQSVIKADTEEVRGMINKVPHLLDVEEIEA